MQQLLSDILNHPTELLAAASPQDLTLLACNKALLEHFGMNQEGYGKKTIYEVMGKKVPREKIKQLSKDLQSQYFVIDENTDPLNQVSFHLFKCEGQDYCIIRLSCQPRTEIEEKFKQSYDQNLAGVFRTDKAGVILSCNIAMARIYGYDNPADLIGKSQLEFYENPEARQALMADLNVNGVLTNYEMFIRRRDGTRVCCLGNSFMERADDGIEYISGTLIDITEKKDMERALMESEQRFRAFAEVTDEGVLFTSDGVILDGNHQIAHMLGSEAIANLLGKRLADFFTMADMQRIRLSAEISPANKTEVRIVDGSGKTIFLEISGSYLEYSGSRVLVLVANDITARKKVELILHQSALRFRYLLENSPGGVVILTEGKFTYLNNSACELFGVAHEDSLFDEDFLNYIPDEFKAEIENDLNDIRAGYKIDYKEIKIQQIDGTTVDVGIKSTLTAYESKPSIQITLNNVTDRNQLVQEQIRMRFVEEINSALKAEIKEHKTTQQKLEQQQRETVEQKAKLESIFNSTENLMMWTINKQYDITGMNKNFVNWMHMFFDEEVQVKDNIMGILQKHLDRDFYQGQLEAFVSGFNGRPQQFEFALRNNNGHTTWLQAFLNPVYIDGRLEELSCLLYDNTERKEMDRRVRDSLKEKEVLLQEVHHRVKNNLQVISSILNLQASYVDDERTLEVLRESQQRIKSMSFIHETIYRTADFGNLEFTDYVRTITNNLVQSYRVGNEDVSVVADMHEIYLSLDQSIPCGLIVNELVSNALKYAFRGRNKGTLTVGLHESNNIIQLSIKDNGVGLPENFGYEKTNSLGIQLVYALIEQLDAEMEIKVKGGTEFLVKFPRK
jgi:PAS domain S-box-containing protein